MKAAQHSYGDDRDYFFRLKKKYIYIYLRRTRRTAGGEKAERVNLKINAEDAGHLRQQR